MDETTPIYGNEEERSLYHEVMLHYKTAKQDLESRIPDFNKKDELFRSHINEKNWPYRTLVFDPRTFTALYEKTARLFANKPRGRMNPREGGDALGAQINNEIVSFQWDDNERVDGSPMLAKWALMDLNARKYGASFAVCKWHWEKRMTKSNGKAEASVFFDGPNFKPLDNRDCLPNPSYSTIKNWFQHREYVTFQELENVNDAARGKPIYKNLHLLKDAMSKDSDRGGDRRDNNYVSKNKELKGLEDYLGTDTVYRTIEIVTEYRNDRWVVFSPRHGIILRDISNPYDHGQIPVIQLKYFPIDDDIYGLSEIEPVEKLQNALNAYICQNLDTLNMSTYMPLKVNQTGGAVQMHTLQFGPGAKWLMNNPATDVVPFEGKPSGVAEFPVIYRFMIGAIAEAYGEASAAVSGLNPTEGQKTAAEIKDTALSRSARDNFNRIFLEEALKKQMMFWLKLNQQFFFNQGEKYKIIKIAGKDALRYFQKAGLDGMGLTTEAEDILANPEMAGTVEPQDFQQPLYPIEVGNGDILPKLNMEDDKSVGSLFVEPSDLSGTYDYIPDVASMTDTANEKATQTKLEALTLIQQPGVQQMLAQEQKKVKVFELLTDYLEDIGFKNADQYFEQMEGGLLNGINGGGEGGPQAVAPGMGNGGAGGFFNGGQAVSNGQNQPVVS